MGGFVNVLVRQLEMGDLVLAAAILLLLTWAAYHAMRWAGVLRAGRRYEAWTRFTSQIGMLLGLEQAYEFTRGQIPYQTTIALVHAYNLLDLEWRHGFFIEERVERFFLQFQSLMVAIDLFYVLAHLVVTAGVIVWIYSRHRRHYSLLRNLFIVSTGLALVAFYLYPTAPPRMLGNYGFVDPLQLHHLIGAGGAQPSSYTYNPYAAMPSLHVTYALVISWVLLLAERRRLVRMLALAYPCAMSAVVVISGNHWLLDVVGAYITFALAGCLVFAGTRVRAAVDALLRARGWPLRTAD